METTEYCLKGSKTVFKCKPVMGRSKLISKNVLYHGQHGQWLVIPKNIQPIGVSKDGADIINGAYFVDADEFEQRFEKLKQ